MILQETASFLRGAVRETDRVYRYGGEEFAIIAPDTEQQGARQLSERLRAGIEDCLPPAGKLITASIGVALIPEHATTSAAVIAAADRALYQAKASGRNRVVIDWGIKQLCRKR
jgi:diguanylate cyclase (GGDEF)-like protein